MVLAVLIPKLPLSWALLKKGGVLIGMLSGLIPAGEVAWSACIIIRSGSDRRLPAGGPLTGAPVLALVVAETIGVVGCAWNQALGA